MQRCKKLAVLVGCNYPNTPFRLHGCINDALAMQDVLVGRFGFDVKLLTDAPASKVMPTGANIKAALNKMVEEAKPGDVLFFYFSGHGTMNPSLEPNQPFRQDEAIVPCDLNLITDVDFRHLVNRVPKGASFTILSDSCHSGQLIDKEKEQIGPASTVKKITTSYYRVRGISAESINQCLNSLGNICGGTGQIIGGLGQVISGVDQVGQGVIGLQSGIASTLSGLFTKDVSLKFHPQYEKDFISLGEDEGILLSGCQANETSAEVVASAFTGGRAHGAFTIAVLQVLNGNKGQLSNRQLVMKAREVLREHGFEQHPCLYCSDENADAPFLGVPTPKPDA